MHWKTTICKVSTFLGIDISVVTSNEQVRMTVCNNPFPCPVSQLLICPQADIEAGHFSETYFTGLGGFQH